MARNDVRTNIMSWLGLTKEKGKKSLKDPERAKFYREEGNAFFKKQDYYSAIKSYTQSAKYATLKNNDFSTAIANRSAAFCHMHRYQESLQDIKLAIDCGYPDVTMWKLYLRTIECHLGLGNIKLAEEELDKLTKLLDKDIEGVSSMKNTILKKAKDLMKKQEKLMQPDRDVMSLANHAVINPEDMLPKNEQFPFASPSLILKTCPNRGRYVIAGKRIRKGELLFVEKPFAWVPVTDGNNASLCAHCCGPMDLSKIPCKGCLEALYCNRTCWDESWSYHQWECPGYHMNLWQQVGVSHLAFKIFIVSATTSNVRSFNDVHKLMTNSDKTKPADMLGLAIASLMVILYMEKYTNFFESVNVKECLVDKFDNKSLGLEDIDVSTVEGKKLYVGTMIFRHSLQMLANAYAVTTIDASTESLIERATLITEQQRLATGAYPYSSMLNHSCDPTVINSFWKNWLIVKSLKDVPAGQEIFNCYGPFFRRMSKSERLVDLSQQYHFNCQCEICGDSRFDYFAERFKGLKCPECSGSSGLTNGIQRCYDCGATSNVDCRDALTKAQSLFDQATEFTEADQPERAIACLKKSLAIRQKYLYKNNEDIAKTLNELGHNYTVIEGQCLVALSYLKRSLSAIEERYGSDSIEVANELNLLTDVCLIYLQRTFNRTTDEYRDTFQEGLKYVDRMVKIVTLTSGPWCNTYQEAKEKEIRFHSLRQWLRF
ncbi:SET and MYND domain-containing protein 4-like isoform X2 [Venturia canescens]|nr:SET and MYND domain-containing protein 4-like isoform X2 [Venturia canescens]XP_043278346.1 SET and MYND domain-containing protein 4-like isoform X2 [Venturia canescens]